MAGPRIRTVKPEWLEDEQLLRAGSHARVLSIALILVADDYGRGRCIPEALAAQVFPFERDSSRVFRESLARLSAMGFVGVYRVREQQYFELRNWGRHQRVDKPGKPRVPAPNVNDFIELEYSRDSRESFPTVSRDLRESLAPDRDQDQDQDQEGERACAIPVPRGTATTSSTVVPLRFPHPPAEECSQKLTRDPASEKPAVVSLDRLWAIWRQVSGCDRKADAPSKQQLESLHKLAKLCSDEADPETHFEQVLSDYAAERRERGKRLELLFFANDFESYAERVARESAPNSRNGISHNTHRAELEDFPPLPEVPCE